MNYQDNRKQEREMCENKRSSKTSDDSQMKRMKIQTTLTKEHKSIKSIEDLSNELFYEIFEYINVCDLYKTFSYLNSRFTHLLFHSSFPIKINLDYSLQSTFEYYCKNFFAANKHRILSLYFDRGSFVDTFLAHCMIDSSFHRLESVRINELRADQFLIILFYLKSLPRLFSLNIILINKQTGNLGKIYRMIFSFPTLKYNKLTLDSYNMDEQLNISLPFAINEPFSNIEYLNINHNCTTQQLFSILRHTPQLHHLICRNLIGSGTGNKQLVTLSNLKYVLIECGFMEIVEFEGIIKNISSQLEVFNILHHSDEGYFDADRWERMIEDYIPHLKKFDYKYHSFDSADHLNNVLYMKLNEFTSPFWTERQWFLKAEISTDVIAYSISSHKFNDYEYSIVSNQQNINTSSMIQLRIHRVLRTLDQLFFDKYKFVFSAVQFTHLNIDHPTISKEMLVKMIQLLPNLDSLKVSSLQFSQSDSFDDNLVKMCSLTSTNNKITKIYHQKTSDMEQIDFLLDLCRRMEHFQLHLSQTIDLNLLLRHILTRTNTLVCQLRSLCLCIPNASEIITDHLSNLIKSESLLLNYTIERCGNNIHLRWY